VYLAIIYLLQILKNHKFVLIFIKLHKFDQNQEITNDKKFIFNQQFIQKKRKI
jgi:hypothetical protein